MEQAEQETDITIITATTNAKKLCNKKPVRQVWIENLVLEYVINLVQDEELLEFIAENTYQYYIAQNTDTSYTDSLQKSLAEAEKAISNLVRAIEQGIFNDATKQRMDELDEQKAEIKAALASAKLKENLGLTKEHIIYFLHQFANMDYTDLECQKLLIKTFINSVFVYDDKVVLTFNYSGDNRTIILMEIDAGLQQGVRLPSMLSHQNKQPPKRVAVCFVERCRESNGSVVNNCRWQLEPTLTERARENSIPATKSLCRKHFINDITRLHHKNSRCT